MVKLGAAATYRAPGDRNAHVGITDPLENRGYALWLSCQGKIKTSKAPLTKGPADRGVGDVDGYEIEVNLKRKCFDLWTELNQMDRHSQEAFTSEVYTYLRQSGNAVCVRQPGIGPGGHGIPVWWLRKEWNDVKAIGIFKQTTLTDREKRLTPQEAGEDREPAPVTVKQREEAAAAKEAADSSTEELETKTEQRERQAIEILANATEPLYQREIGDMMGGLPSLTVGRVLRDLQNAGKVFRRQESTDERPADATGRYRFLYWREKKVPARTTPMGVGNQTMERVWALKPGESMATGWMSPGNQAQVRELVEQGLLEYINAGTDKERVRLAPTTPTLEEATEETAAVPAPAPESPGLSAKEKLLADSVMPPAPKTEVTTTPLPLAVSEISHAIQRLIDSAVIEASGAATQLSDEVRELKRQLDTAHQRRAAVETALIAARTELSAAQRELAEIKPKWETLQSLFNK